VHSAGFRLPAPSFSVFENNGLRALPAIGAGTRYRAKIMQNCCVAQ
jgi:hypothetical protein